MNGTISEETTTQSSIMSSPSEATTSTRNISLTEEAEEAAAATPTPALQPSKSLPASSPRHVTPINQQASSSKFTFSPSGDVTPNNQQASSSNVTVPPPGENTLNERIGLITNSVGVVLTKYEDEKEELKAEKKQLSDRVDARDDKIEDLEATIQSKTEEVTKKNAALAQKEKHNKRDKDIHKQIQDKMNKDIRGHKQDIAAWKEETQKKMNELDDAEEKYTTLKQEATAYKRDTETQLITKQKDIEQLKGKMVELRGAHTIECAEKDSTIETVRAENMNLTSENKKLQDALVSKEDIHITTLASKNLALTSKDEELETTKAMVDQLRIQLKNLGIVKQEIITEAKKQKSESTKEREANLRRNRKGVCDNLLPIAIANTQIVDSDSDDDDKYDDDEDDDDDDYEDVVDDDGNIVTIKNVGMNPTNTSLNEKCDICGEELCTGDIKDCGTDIVFKRKCLGCGSTFGSKGAYVLHVKGDTTRRRGCVRWGRKFPVHIESYKKAYNERTDEYRPTFILNDRTEPASRNEQKAHVKHIETVLTEDKF